MNELNIVGIEIESFGGMEGGSHYIGLEQRRSGGWKIVKKDRKYCGSREKRSRKRAKKDIINEITTIIADYDWRPMKDLPPSEIQMLDADKRVLRIRFAVPETFLISDTQELSPEACEMWQRLERLLRSV